MALGFNSPSNRYVQQGYLSGKSGRASRADKITNLVYRLFVNFGTCKLVEIEEPVCLRI